MSTLERLWYGSTPWLMPLWPLEALFGALARKRRRSQSRAAWQAEVPVLVVGNISVGGVGKTPLVIWLVEQLQQAGYRPGVVSRGYGGRASSYPLSVGEDTDPAACGDEPLMIARRCRCPVVVDPDRVAACRRLLAEHAIDLIISDDGLQHYRLARALEIAVIDGQRGLGNGHCLPVGPLREPPARLQQVDFRVVNGSGWSCDEGFVMTLKTDGIRRLDGAPADLPAQPVNAVAGIGNPQRFFDTLAALGYQVVPHPFADHHGFQASDLAFGDDLPVVMTEKDAVKCRAFAHENRYYLPVSASLPAAFRDQLLKRIASLIKG